MRLLLYPGSQMPDATTDCPLDQPSIARPVHDDRAGIVELGVKGTQILS